MFWTRRSCLNLMLLSFLLCAAAATQAAQQRPYDAQAYKAAQARNVKAIVDLNAELYESCQSCHEHYRPGYRRRL